MPILSDAVQRLLPLPDNRLYLGGRFTFVGSVVSRGIARLAADGSVDPSFAQTEFFSPSDALHAMTIDSAGRVTADGDFRARTENIPRLFRFLPDGSLDPGFQSNPLYPGGPVYGLTTQADDRLVAGGAFISPWVNVMRLWPSGLADNSFGYSRVIDPQWGPDGPAYAVVGQGNGMLVVGGDFTRYGSLPRLGLVRLFPNGTVDPSFACRIEPSGGVRGISVDPGGRILIVGSFTHVNGIPRHGVARLHSEGSLDTTFDLGGEVTIDGSSTKAVVSALSVDTQGRALIGGVFDDLAGIPRRNLARLRGDAPGVPMIVTSPSDVTADIGSSLALQGTVRWTPGTSIQWYHEGAPLASGTNSVFAIIDAQPSDGGIYTLVASNRFGSAATLAAVTIADLPPPPGALLTTFTNFPPLNGGVAALAFHDGKLIAGGSFTEVNGSNWNGLVRFNLNGSIDTGFGTPQGVQGPFTVVNTSRILVQPDGAVLLGGFWQTIYGHDSPHFARVGRNGSFDSSFDIGTGPDSVDSENIHGIAVDPWQRLVVIGSFLHWNGASTPTRVVRLHSDGAVDPSFAPEIGDRTGQGLAVDTHGRILLSAFPPSESNTPSVLRLLPDGRIDPRFTPARCDDVQRLLLLPDGSILLGGGFNLVDGETRRGLARLLPDGGLDEDFHPALDAAGTVLVAETQPDGKILIGGAFSSIDGVPRNNLARLNPDGTVDLEFDIGPGANTAVRAIAVSDDGTIAIGGVFSRFNRVASRYLALVSGGPFSAPVIDSGPLGVTLNAGQPLLLAVAARALPAPAYQWFVNDAPIAGATNRTLRIESARLSDSGFYAARVTNALGGSWSALADVQIFPASVLPGANDAAFNSGLGADDTVDTVVVDPVGRILIGGRFTHVDGQPRRNVARLFSDGRLDPAFDAGEAVVGGMMLGGYEAHVATMALQPGGKLLVGGSFTNFNGIPRLFLCRLLEDGAVDTTFDARLGGVPVGVSTLLVQPDGKILVGGAIFSVNGVLRESLARLHADGSLDTGFFPGSGPNGQVLDLALNGNGLLYVAGLFRLFDGESRGNIARVRADGSLDPAFAPPSPFIQPDFADPCFPVPGVALPNQISRALTVAAQPDNAIIVGGLFTSLGGLARTNLVRLSASGAVDPHFAPNPNHAVHAVTLLPGGQILIAGCFTSVSGEPRPGLARLHRDGSLDMMFNPDVSISALPGVRALAATEEGSILIGGAFSAVNGRQAGNLARLSGGPVILRQSVADQKFTVELASIAGRDYILEFTPSLPATTWVELQRARGDGGLIVLGGVDLESKGFYRVRVE